MASYQWMKLWFDMFDRPKNIALSDEAWRAYLHLARLAMESSDFGVIRAKDWPSMAKTIHMDSRKFRRVIEELSSKFQGKVEISERDCLELTIVNISEFQSRKPSEQPERTRERKRKSRECHTPSHPVTPIEKEKEESISKPSCSTTAKSAVLSDFDTWWSEYPKKRGKGAAKTAYERARTKVDAGTLIGAISAYTKSREFRDGFVVYPATWLNQERWTDEYDEVKPQRAMRAPCTNPSCINGLIYDRDTDTATKCPDCRGAS